MTPIDEYISMLQDSPERKELERVRDIIRQVAPESEEVISYGMPVFKYRKKYLIGFSAFKDHLSIFPGPEAIEAVKDKLGGYKTAKGTIQFTANNPLPEELVIEILRHRITDIIKT